MGTPLSDVARNIDCAAHINIFHSTHSWIEGIAIDQLDQVANVKGVQKIAAFPDLHPGKYGPVGCAILADRVYPHLIGNDIGCGMSLFLLDLSARKIRVEKAAEKLRTLEGLWDGDIPKAIRYAGLPTSIHDRSLGTIGGGNHFCELQAVDSIFDETSARAVGLSKNCVLLLVHSGSRSMGAEVFRGVQNNMVGLTANTVEANAHLKNHDRSVEWACLNRKLIAERAALALRASVKLIADSPHNLIENHEGMYLHRKGAAKADIALVPLAGSRDALSYLLKPTGQIDRALNSLSHGAGRKYDRQSMLGRVGSTKSDRSKLERTSFGGRVVCDDRQLLLEEAPQAYKDSRAVVDDLMQSNLATPVVSLKPLVTFKKASAHDASDRQDKQQRLLQRRRDR